MEFIESKYVSQVRENNGNAPFKLLKNPKTGKYFWNCGDQQGPISNNWDWQQRPVVTRCIDDNGEELHILHAESSQNVVMELE